VDRPTTASDLGYKQDWRPLSHYSDVSVDQITGAVRKGPRSRDPER
jgi:hypothetical protein